MENMVKRLKNWKGKRVLVNGHTGFKGSWLSAWLQQLGATVIGIALKPNTKPNHFNLLKLDLDSHIIDIRDAKKIQKLIQKIKPDFIFHLAAQPLVRESYIYPLETLQTNILGTANILNGCRHLDDLRGVLVVTSDKCYENQEQNTGYRETDPMGGHDPYSMSKGCAELVTASFRNSFFDLEQFRKTHQTLVASARAGNVMGGGDWSEDRLIPDIIRATVQNKETIIRSPHATRPWQHVLDCLSGYLCLATQLLSGKTLFAQAWNFGPNDNDMMSVLTVVEQIQAIWPKVKYRVVKEKNQPHEANLLTLNCSKAKEKLGWRSVWPLEKSILETIEWYREFYDAKQILTLKQIQAFQKDANILNLFQS